MKNYELVEECFCFEDQGAGYTYTDEFGDCPIHEFETVIRCLKCGGVFGLDKDNDGRCTYCHEKLEE